MGEALAVHLRVALLLFRPLFPSFPHISSWAWHLFPSLPTLAHLLSKLSDSRIYAVSLLLSCTSDHTADQLMVFFSPSFFFISRSQWYHHCVLPVWMKPRFFAITSQIFTDPPTVVCVHSALCRYLPRHVCHDLHPFAVASSITSGTDAAAPIWCLALSLRRSVGC